MRVLFVVNNFPSTQRPIDGIFNLRMVQAVRERGHEVSVIRVAPHVPPWTQRWQRFSALPTLYEIDGVRIRVFRGFMGPKRWGVGTLALQLRAALRREIATFGPDLLHVHGLIPAGVLALDCSLPFVLTAHGSETYALALRRPGLRTLAQRVVASASRLVGVSAFIAGYLERLGARDVTVIYNGADEATFAPQSRARCRVRLGLHLQGPVVAFAAHVMREKGIFDLLEALAQLRDVSPTLLVAGAGECAAEVEDRARERSLAVRLLGHLDQRSVATVFGACDAFVLPSHFEGLPTAVCEAMMMGRAVVATSAGGTAEIVIDGKTGAVVPPHNPTELAGALRAVLVDPLLRARYERNARAFATEHLTWRRNAAAYEALYSKVVSEPLKGRPPRLPPLRDTPAARLRS